jgi:hypothetical protein
VSSVSRGRVGTLKSRNEMGEAGDDFIVAQEEDAQIYTVFWGGGGGRKWMSKS